jgi:hypothetical protein
MDPTPCPPSSSWVKIWTERGDGATYRIGDSVRVCYSVGRPMQIEIVDILADGRRQTFAKGYDDGTGDCIQGRVTPPTGYERMVIYGENGLTASTYFYVR